MKTKPSNALSICKFSFQIAVLIISALFVSCDTYNQTVNRTFTKLSNDSCTAANKQKNVFMFFDGEAVNFNYTRVGLIEAAGNVTTDDKEILDRLKLNAYQNCANAIINIKSETVSRTYDGYKSSGNTYVSKVYKGLAVRIQPDSLYYSSKLGNYKDTSFIKNVINYDLRNDVSQKNKSETLLIVIAVAVFVTILATLSSKSH